MTVIINHKRWASPEVSLAHSSCCIYNNWKKSRQNNTITLLICYIQVHNSPPYRTHWASNKVRNPPCPLSDKRLGGSLHEYARRNRLRAFNTKCNLYWKEWSIWCVTVFMCHNLLLHFIYMRKSMFIANAISLQWPVHRVGEDALGFLGDQDYGNSHFPLSQSVVYIYLYMRTRARFCTCLPAFLSSRHWGQADIERVAVVSTLA